MKRILSSALILALLGGTSLWALRGPENGRTYNRDMQEIRGGNQADPPNPKWAKAVGADSDGPINSSIEVEVDYEYFGEPPFVKKGYDYYAYANVWGDGVGSWSVYASVPDWIKGTDSDSLSGGMDGDIYRYVDASGFKWDLRGAPDAESKLSNCSAKGKISVINHKSESKRW